jgi:hypothetical protein
MAVFKYTTQISAETTVNEIQKIISKAGAKKITVDYDEKQNPVNLTFAIMWNDSLVFFSLPCRWQGVLKCLNKDKTIPLRYKNNDQALRVGWRIEKAWIQSQIAIVEAEMATLAEIFLASSITKNGERLFDNLNKDNSLLLTQ